MNIDKKVGAKVQQIFESAKRFARKIYFAKSEFTLKN